MNTPLRTAMISEHASALATIRRVDAGGRNIDASDVPRHLGRDGVVQAGCRPVPAGERA